MTNNTGRIGIITGAGPEAGIDLWSKILTHNKQLYGDSFTGDCCAPEVFVHSLPELGLAMNISQNEDVLWQAIKRGLQGLKGRADYVCIACNILHYFSKRIERLDIDAQFVSIVDITEETAKANKDCAILSISNVIEGGHYSPYRETLRQLNIETPQSVAMDKLVSNIKKHGGKHSDSVFMFENILRSLESNNLLLACTELPLLPLEKFSNKRFFDLSLMLAQKVATLSYKDRAAQV